MSEIGTGDFVLHKPSGERWIVAFVEGERIHWVGWPEGDALLADCVLIEYAEPEFRDWLLRDMAAIRDDRDARGRYARRVLGDGGSGG